VKTAARDIDFIRDRWGMPVGYDDKRHGFYFTEKVDRLPSGPVTEAELFAVCVSLNVVEL
jgi:predicted DNA-binding transcriptional regulator YafY